jgi:hypothetical protein
VGVQRLVAAGEAVAVPSAGNNTGDSGVSTLELSGAGKNADDGRTPVSRLPDVASRLWADPTDSIAALEGSAATHTSSVAARESRNAWKTRRGVIVVFVW